MTGAGQPEPTSPSRLIAALNALGAGDLDKVNAKLVEAAEACASSGQPELRDRLMEARAALNTGDLRTFRKRVETVVARLGHLR